MTVSAFDAVAAHRHFSAACFNKAWEYIEKTDRTAEDDEQMLLCALTSLWHWTQREDCGDMQRSIGHWQVSRVYCLLGKPDESLPENWRWARCTAQMNNALHHAARCLHYSEKLPAFYKAYAHEAFARVYSTRLHPALVLGNPGALNEHLGKARTLLKEITDDAERHLLETDLATIKGWEHFSGGLEY